jgi:AbrB family looped-hinge helix DNA binding protein
MDKGLVVIPRQIREEMGLKKGDQLVFVKLGGRVSIFRALEDPIRQMRGILKSSGSMADFLAEKRRELEQEEKDLPPPLSER